MLLSPDYLHVSPIYISPLFFHDSVMACHSSLSQLVIAPEPDYPSLNTYRLPRSVGLVSVLLRPYCAPVTPLLRPIAPPNMYQSDSARAPRFCRLDDPAVPQSLQHSPHLTLGNVRTKVLKVLNGQIARSTISCNPVLQIQVSRQPNKPE